MPQTAAAGDESSGQRGVGSKHGGELVGSPPAAPTVILSWVPIAGAPVRIGRHGDLAVDEHEALASVHVNANW